VKYYDVRKPAWLLMSARVFCFQIDAPKSPTDSRQI
jgi:hypothetical protein